MNESQDREHYKVDGDQHGQGISILANGKLVTVLLLIVTHKTPLCKGLTKQVRWPTAYDLIAMATLQSANYLPLIKPLSAGFVPN
jgi:hypothetical protein